jgi:hypothetical protein
VPSAHTLRPGLLRPITLVTAAAWALLVFAGLAPSAHAAPATTSTPVTASPAQVAGQLFVAGDVARLGRAPSGTESIVLEQVLQQLYTDNRRLAPGDAVEDIQGLQGTLAAGGADISPATLTVMGGNQRVIAILAALARSHPPGPVALAITQVAQRALNEASDSTQMLGRPFDASADSMSTFLYGSFSPPQTLEITVSVAAADRNLGRARDTLWLQASHESVFSATAALVASNPALQAPAVHALVARLQPNGSLQSTVGDLETVVGNGVATIGQQTCVPSAGGTGPVSCSSGALFDVQQVTQACPNGTGDASAACQSERETAKGNVTAQLATIASQQAATTAAGGLIAQADANLARAEQASAQAAAQLANDEANYASYQNIQTGEHAAGDVIGLIVSLSVAEVDPVAAVNGVISVIGDVVGFGAPDANQLILTGLQDISKQLSAFEQYTSARFNEIDARLSGLADQVSATAYRLSAQLADAQAQITGLGNALSSLQGSVDRLQSEVQALFAQDARNGLGTIIDQFLGYEATNGQPPSLAQVSFAAGALYQDATATALSPTVLSEPAGFTALDASALVRANGQIALDPNINLFNQFAPAVSDSFAATPWPGPLSSTCAAGSDPGAGLCLPDPDFWAASARAFAQLLMENPTYVTRTRLAQLSAMTDEGTLLQNALAKISAHDATNADSRTGSKVFDAALDYYLDWGRGTHPSGAPPSLEQAIHNEEHRWLSTQAVPGTTSLTDAGIDPWGGANQAPDIDGLQTMSAFTNIPAEGNATFTPTAADALPKLPNSLVSFLPAPVLNAQRLGVGQITVSWNAFFASLQPVNAGGQAGTLYVFLTYGFSGPPDSTHPQGIHDTLATVFQGMPNVRSCSASSDTTIAGTQTALSGWMKAQGGCGPDMSGQVASDIPAAVYASTNDGRFAAASADATPLVDRALSALQQGAYQDLLGDGSTLTSGAGQATDVRTAADRFAGAGAVLDGYVSLGLPQALASDDNLRSLVSGVGSDPFRDTRINGVQAPFTTSITRAIVDFYKVAQQQAPTFDPALLLGDLAHLRQDQLSEAIRPYIQTGRAEGQTTADGGVLAELSPLVAPTVDRLQLTRDVLSAGMDGTLIPAAPPAAVTGAASALTRTSATLHGTVDPNRAAVSVCRFDYGTTATYGASVPCAQTVRAGTTGVAVSAAISRLRPGTTYHYRLVAVNGQGTGVGTDGTLRTPRRAGQ